MRLFEAILFDFDGVLADTEALHFACWTEALAPHGVHLDWPTYREHCIGLSEPDFVAFVAARAGREEDFNTLWAEYPRKQALFRQRSLAEPPISEEVVELLRTLSSYKLGLVTSTSRHEIEPVLRRAGILDRFDTLICGEDVSRHKPAPEPYLLAAQRLGVSRVLVVEDSPAGLASACAAGFEVLHLPEPGLLAELLRATLQPHFR